MPSNIPIPSTFSFTKADIIFLFSVMFRWVGKLEAVR